jgi:hypothetical protein
MADNENNRSLIPLDINQSPDAFISADEIAEAVEVADAFSEISAEGELIRDIKEKFYAAERGKESDEARWLDAYHNYRGIYGRDVQFRENEKSRVFIKATKTKVLAAYGQLVDVVFGGNKFPISIEPTKIPEGIAEYAHLSDAAPSIETTLQPEAAPQQVEANPLDIGFAGDGKMLKPGAVMGTPDKFLGGLEDELSDQSGTPVVAEGPGRLPQSVQISPAKIAARRMEKLIIDQIEESDGAIEIRNALFEAALLGHGVIKGPFNYNKTLHRWVMEDGKRVYKPETVRVPRVEFVSIWDFYPDPAAKSMKDAEWVIHRHRYNRSQLRDLKNFPHFNKDTINSCIVAGPNYQNKDFENEISSTDDQLSDVERFEVLEYWGIVDRDLAESVGIEIPETSELNTDEVQVNIWICHDQILRAVVNPFTPSTIPYLAFPYERNPYSFFGIGVAENMTDSQLIMNGHARMAIDNLALSGSLIFDIDESMLAPGQSMEIYPGKIFRRQAGMPGQAVHAQKFPNTVTENLQMFDKFRQLADEATGMPSYSHGQTGIQSTTRTAAGMQMLMGAASLNIKTVIKNLDDFLLKPLADSYYRWNMTFYQGDLAIEGDLEIKATGTSSLIQKEVRSQRLTMFLQTAQNPAIAPFVRLPTLVKELAYTLDIDPDEILNDPDQARLYAEIIGLQKGAEAASAAPVADAGGQTGVVALPGEEAFSGVTTPPMEAPIE